MIEDVMDMDTKINVRLESDVIRMMIDDVNSERRGIDRSSDRLGGVIMDGLD